MLPGRGSLHKRLNTHSLQATSSTAHNNNDACLICPDKSALCLRPCHESTFDDINRSLRNGRGATPTSRASNAMATSYGQISSKPEVRKRSKKKHSQPIERWPYSPRRWQ